MATLILVFIAYCCDIWIEHWFRWI